MSIMEELLKEIVLLPNGSILDYMLKILVLVLLLILVAQVLLGCNQDLVIAHPDTIGEFEGSCDSSKIIINPNSDVAVVFSDNGSNGIGEVIVQSLLQGNNYSKLVNLSEMVRVGTTMGLISGGVLTAGTGLNLNVGAGNGFIVAPAQFSDI